MTRRKHREQADAVIEMNNVLKQLVGVVKEIKAQIEAERAVRHPVMGCGSPEFGAGKGASK